MHLIFDIIIALLITSGFGLLYLCWFSNYASHQLIRKNRLYIKIISSFAILVIIVIGYGSFIEPRRLIVTHTNITISQRPTNAETTVAVIADLHMGPYVKADMIHKINSTIEEIDPDIIVMPGDFIFNDERNAYYLKELQTISQQYPTYAIWGNHDYNAGRKRDEEIVDRTTLAQKIFDTIGIHSINNQAITINNDIPFTLIGIDELWADKADFTTAFGSITDTSLPKVLLVHNPDAVLNLIEQNKKTDLLIAGHTHGGQIRLPFIGPVPTLPTKLGKQYDQGLLNYNDYTLYITSGIGMMGTRARLFNPPEISVLHIH